MKTFNTANDAFEHYYDLISNEGIDYSGTKCLFNVGFTIDRPSSNDILASFRKWNKGYAEFEWQWYLSGDKNATEIAKRASIWYNCMDSNNNVNSNYGWHWQQNDQLGYVINELRNNPQSRRASISIYNAKDRTNFENDTPCTYAVNFCIVNDKLNMSVMMRSNDLWFGFCNDQYCFSKLQEMVGQLLGVEIGTYFHFANNLHIYNNKLNKQQ